MFLCVFFSVLLKSFFFDMTGFIAVLCHYYTGEYEKELISAQGKIQITH